MSQHELSDNTFTYTARSQENPERVATFTLQNGHVAVQLGDALIEQVERLAETLDKSEEQRLRSWLEPAATGAIQRALQPIDIQDFDAALDGATLRTTAWLRAGGLRVAPLVVGWSEVDNLEAARAFVDEVENRRQQLPDEVASGGPLDYWASWILLGIASIAVPLLWLRFFRRRDAGTHSA